MTIMGILSAVGIAAPAGVLNVLLGDRSTGFKDRLLAAGPFFVIFGSVSCLLAAFSFYGQRSLLAWYYGQMCLTESMDDSPSNFAKSQQYVIDADSWETWIRYQWGIIALVTGFAEYIAAIFFVLCTPGSWLYLSVKFAGRVIPIISPFLALLHWYVFRHYRLNDKPWADFLSDLSCFSKE